MSTFTIINDVSLEIRRRIFASLNSAPGVTLNFSNEASNIVFSAPQETPENGARLSLYLYHISVNGPMRNQRLLPHPGHTDELTLPPLPLELRYIATPMDEEENNQLIIGRLLQFIYDQSVIDTIDDQPLGNGLGGGSSTLRVTPDLMNVEQLSQLWNAFNQSFRLSVAFQVDVVAVDSARAPVVVPRVVDALVVSGVRERI
ncbi:Pvc16 family protein [Nitrosomonas sp.]|uniref:Pvc16 family protein n=1 Tax=Nitrosomonas sp. TaxID=42353 RepID=UPI003305CF95